MIQNQTLMLKHNKDRFHLKINGTEIGNAASYAVKNSADGLTELDLKLHFISENTSIEIEK